MCAMVRYIFPGTDPWGLDTEELVRLWREAQYVIKTFRLIEAEPKSK